MMVKQPLLLLLLLGMARMTLGADTPAESQATSWGEPVEGVQLRLAIATALPVLPGEPPALQISIRNQGTVALSVQPEALGFAQIEVDGIWFAQEAAMLGINSRVVIAPGAQRDMALIRSHAFLMYEMGATSRRGFVLRPGSHRIRVRNLTEPRLLNIRTAEGKLLELVSNEIVINVQGLSASAEREWLAAQVTARGVESEASANTDPDLTPVQVISTRIQMPRAIACVSVEDPGIHRTPEQQAHMDTEGPEVRQAMEAVERYIAADLTRNRSMLRVHFQQFEDRGDAIWFTYKLEYPTCVLSSAHNEVTMAYVKKTGEVRGRNP